MSKNQKISTKRWKKLQMAKGESRNAVNKAAEFRKALNQCFEEKSKNERRGNA